MYNVQQENDHLKGTLMDKGRRRLISLQLLKTTHRRLCTVQTQVQSEPTASRAFCGLFVVNMEYPMEWLITQSQTWLNQNSHY